MVALAFVLAVILAVFGIVLLLNGSIIAGIVCLVLACAIGPGGWAVWR